MIACVRRETQTLCRGWWGAKVRISPNKEHSLVKTQVAGLWCLRVTTAFRFPQRQTPVSALATTHGSTGRATAHRGPRGSATAAPSVFFLPGFSRDFDCFDSENEWDGKVVFVGF